MTYTDHISINDFKRELSLSLTGQGLADLNDYIQEVSESTMRDMFGEYYSEFTTGVEEEDATYLAVWDIAKKSCIYFTYFAFCEFIGRMHKSGKYTDVLSNSDKMDVWANNNFVNVIYNKGVSEYNYAQEYMFENNVDFSAKHKEQKWLM